MKQVETFEELKKIINNAKYTDVWFEEYGKTTPPDYLKVGGDMYLYLLIDFYKYSPINISIPTKYCGFDIVCDYSLKPYEHKWCWKEDDIKRKSYELMKPKPPFLYSESGSYYIHL